MASPVKEVRGFGGACYLLEHAMVPDYALVHAWKADRHGNPVYRRAARNFNPDCAAAAKTTVAQVQHLVEPGELDPDSVHTPGSTYTVSCSCLTSSTRSNSALSGGTVSRTRDELAAVFERIA